VKYVLLRLSPHAREIIASGGNLYFVTELAWATTDAPPTDGDLRYLFEEHTCPTNVTGAIAEVISVSNVKVPLVDRDNHGLFEYLMQLEEPDIEASELIDIHLDCEVGK
jgi:hypothetical protein